MGSLFKVDIENLKGVGPKSADLFRKLGVGTVGRLLYLFPRSYEDWTRTVKISEIENFDDPACIRVRAASLMKTLPLNGGGKLYKISVSDGENLIDVLFFNSPYSLSKLSCGEECLLMGKVAKTYDGYQIICPKIKKASEETALTPVYSQLKGLPSWKIEAAVKNALSMIPERIEDTLPEYALNKYDLCELEKAIKDLHFPKTREDSQRARRRLIFEDVLAWRLGLSIIKRYVRPQTQAIIKRNYVDDFFFLLPFVPTGAQRRAVSECLKDISSCEGLAMGRLLQGDVGSGKTVVAAAVAYNVIKNGFQAAVMVPTEILAAQHYATFSNLFMGTDVKVGLLTGDLKRSKKTEVIEKLKSGDIDLIIGTHSLISEKTEFHNLGLVITDEQHRFGVRQRAKLINKGINPHMLIISATPIPRTLALISYGDLDISVLDELPPGRKTIETTYVNSKKRSLAFERLKCALENGLQGYIVCPGIEESDANIAAVKVYKDRLLKRGFEKYKIEILHGKLPSDEKEDVMKRFAGGEIDVLITTTVIEVGVDVPKASVIIIENAERFGLAQIHQLRGRVGRGKHKSYCILVSDSTGETALKRFEAAEKSNDGFYLANEDLKIRGPGEAFGVRQHGGFGLEILRKIEDISVINEVKDAACDILRDSPDLSGEALRFIRARVKSMISSIDDKFTL